MDYSVSVVTSYHFQNKVRYWSKTPIFLSPQFDFGMSEPLNFYSKNSIQTFYVHIRYSAKILPKSSTTCTNDALYGVVWHRTAWHDVVRCRTATCVARAAPYSVNGSPSFQSICGFLCREIGQVLISCRPLANRFELFNFHNLHTIPGASSLTCHALSICLAELLHISS